MTLTTQMPSPSTPAPHSHTSPEGTPQGSLSPLGKPPAHPVSSRASHLSLDFEWLGEVEYGLSWERQEAETARRKASAEDPQQVDTARDVVLLLTHPSVYTAGRMTEESDLPTNGAPVVHINRGGRITWHGPGQLVGYPIIKLAEPLDVIAFVRRTEEALIRVVADFGVVAGRVNGRSGVWVPSDDALGVPGHRPERKIAALGYHLTGGVSQHGFALNCCNSLEPYMHIVPCGISDAAVTTLSLELGETITPEDVLPIVKHYFQLALDGELELTEGEIPR